MFSLESPQRGDPNEYTQYTISQYKKESHPPFQQYFSHRLCEGNNAGTHFTVGKIPLPGGIKPGMDNLPFHILLNSISIISG